MEKSKKLVNLLSTLTLIFIILYLNIYTIYLTIGCGMYQNVSYVLFLFGMISLILYVVYKIINKEKAKLKDVIILLLILCGAISSLFAINPYVSIFGSFGRYEGLLVIISYYMFFLLATTIPLKYKKIIMYIFIFTGIIEVLIGNIQFFKIGKIFNYDRTYNLIINGKYATGTMGNQNFYSSYVLMCLLFSFGGIFKSSKIYKINYLCLTIFFMYGLFIGNTLGCILTFILLGGIILIKNINKSNYKKFILFLVLICILFSSFIFLFDKKLNFKKNMINNINEVGEILKGNINDSTGTGRIYIWRKSLSMSYKHILTGIGIDNLIYIDSGKCIKGLKATCFDKAHNEYIQKYVTEGIFSILIYLFLIGYVLKKCNKETHYQIYLVVLSYIIQSTFNISVITVAPIFYIVLGFLGGRHEEDIICS